MSTDAKKTTEQLVIEMAGQVGTVAKAVEDTGIKLASMEAENKSLRDKLDEQIRKFNDKRISLRGGDNMLAVIPESRRKVMKLAEISCQQWKDPQKGAAMPRLCMFPDDVPIKAAYSEWMRLCCLKLARPGEFYPEHEYFEKLSKAMEEGVEKVALQEDTASEGGNLVPTIVEAEILRLIADNSLLRPLVRKVTMTTKTHAYPTRAAAFSAAIIAEEGSITDSVPASPFSQSNLTAKKLAAFATVAQELMQDNVVLLGDYLGTEFAEQIGLLEDKQALEGDGTGVNFTGVIAASGVNSLVSGANGEVLYWSKLAEVPWTAGESQSRSGAYWFFGPKLMKVLVKSRADAVAAADNAGLPIFVSPSSGIGSPAPMSVLGFPYVIHSGLRTDITRGTGTALVNAYFGPPRSIIFGDLLGFRIDLNPWSKFQTFQIDIRGVKRTGILVGVPSAWTKYIAIDPGSPMKA